MSGSDTEPGPQDEPDDGDDDGTDPDDGLSPVSLSTLNKKQLLEWCTENGVADVSESMTKADILAYLTEHGYA